MKLAFLRLDPFIASLVGVVALASLLPARGTFADVVGIVSQAGIALLFFLHGARLPTQAVIDGIGRWRLHLMVLSVTFVLFPIAGVGLSRLPILGELSIGLLFLTLLPSTVQSSIALTAIARGNVAAAVCSASLSNVVGIFLTPLMTSLLISNTEMAGGNVLLSIQGIALQLLAPFIAGQLVRPWISGWLLSHKSLTTGVDRGSILLVVYGAFSAAVLNGLWQRLPPMQLGILVAICLGLLLVVLGISWWWAKSAGLSHEDSIVLLFCGSKKSLASGVPMAGMLFPAATVGVILLPVMIFHQLQLIVCAILARRLAHEVEHDEALSK